MLIRILILLVAANLGWFFWAHTLRGSAPQTEPERLTQQLHPEAVQVQEAPPLGENGDDAGAPPAAKAPPPAVIITQSAPANVVEPVVLPFPVPDNGAPPTALKTAAPAPKTDTKPEPKPEPRPRTACLQAGTFNERQIEEVRRRAAALPAGSWNVQAVSLPDRWMVFLPAADELGALARRAELRAQGIDTDRPSPGHGPGVSLGRYTSEERARMGLSQLVARGVQGARIVTERQSARAWTLRLPSATPELRERAQRTLGNALAGHKFQECGTDN